MINELMIDIETTGTRPGCKVLALGAFGFDKEGKQVEFYRRFDAAKMGADGFSDDPKTMEWWQGQSNEAYAEAFGGKVDPREGLGEFRQWFIENFTIDRFKDFEVWCCGGDFDFPILAEFSRIYGYRLPWINPDGKGFWLQSDYRTIRKHNPFIKQYEGNVLKHTALEDAKAQMRGLRAYYEREEVR